MQLSYNDYKNEYISIISSNHQYRPNYYDKVMSITWYEKDVI